MIPALHTRGSPQLALDAGGPFNTIATGSAGSGRLLDLTAGQLAAMRRGAHAWVESVKDYFRWDPTSTETADSLTVCNPTVNVGNAGRLVRCLIPAPEWARRSWFIDETNGNDENDGLSSGTAIKTDAELARRWGSLASIASPVTVQYLTNPAGQTNLRVQLLPGGSITFTGTRTTSKTGTLSAVTTQDRTNHIPWDVTEATLGAADVGKIIRITSGARVGAYAYILKDLTGGKLRTTPFMTYAPHEATPTTLVTPQAGDPFEVVTLITLNAGLIEIRASGLAVVQSPFQNGACFDSLMVDGGASFNGTIDGSSVKVFYGMSIIKRMRIAGFPGSSAFHTVCGGGLDTTVVAPAGIMQLRSSGVIGSLTVSQGAAATLLNDTISQGARLSMTTSGRAVSSGGAAWFDCASDSAIVIPSGCYYTQTGGTADWGTSNAGHGVVVQSGGGYVYATKPTVNSGLGAGREAKVGGTDKLWSAIPYFEATNGASLVALA